MTNNIIGFLGSQQGMNSFQKQEVLKCFDKYVPSTVHHGGYKGADEDFHDLFISYSLVKNPDDYIIHIHPSLDTQKWMVGLPTFITANFANVKVSAPEKYFVSRENFIRECDVILACPKEVEHSLHSATWKSIRYAWKQKKEVIIIPPIFAEAHQ